MVDLLTLGLMLGLMALAAIRLILRDDLDTDPPVSSDHEATGEGQPGA